MTMGFMIALTIGGSGTPSTPPTLQVLTLSTNEGAEGVDFEADVIGATDGSTLTLTGADAAYFSINSATRKLTATNPPDGTFEVGIVETLAGATGSPNTTSFSVTFAPIPALQDLALSTDEGTAGTDFSALIIGVTPGSLLTLAGTDAASFSIVGSNLIALDPPEDDLDVSIVETLPGAVGSPKTTPFTVSFAAAPTPGTVLVTVPTAPKTRFHPHTGASTLSSGHVASATDIMGYANASNGAGTGPRELTDALGRKFWRFRSVSSAQFLQVAGLLALNSQAMAVFVVGRRLSGSVLSLGINGVNAWSSVSVARCIATGTGNATRKPYIANQTPSTVGPFYVGFQMQVLGFLGRTTGNGNGRVSLNRTSASVGLPSSSGSIDGCEIGRYAASPGNASNPNLTADVYDLLIYQGVGTMSNAQFDAIRDALCDGWDIPEATHDVILDGDSITFGLAIGDEDTNGVYGEGNMEWLLTAPGGPFALPMTTRVFKPAVSGSFIVTSDASLNPKNRATVTDSIYNGTGRIAGDLADYYIQIGVNDIPSSGANNGHADAARNALVAHINTASTGMLQRGCRVIIGINISNGNATKNPIISYYRTLLRDPQFLVDCDAGPGGTYEGRVVFADLDQITYSSSGTLFSTQADAGDSTYYQGDGLHPVLLGNQMMLTGGDTPQHGIRSQIYDFVPPLETLRLSVTSGTQDLNYTSTILGTRAGSVLTLGGAHAADFSLNSATRTLTSSAPNAGNRAITITETLPGVPDSPKVNSFTIPIASPAIPLIAPAIGWTGSPGTGGSLTRTGTDQGSQPYSGWMHGTLATPGNWIFNEVVRPDGLLNQDGELCILAADGAGTESVQFYVEGSTATATLALRPIRTFSGVVMRPVWTATLDYSAFPMDGDFEIYATISSGRSGIQNRVIGPVRMTRQANYDRIIQVGAGLADNGDLTQSTLKKAIKRAFDVPIKLTKIVMTEDTVIDLAAQSLNPTTNPSLTNGRRGVIDIDDGGFACKIHRTSGTGSLRLYINCVSWIGWQFDMQNITQLYAEDTRNVSSYRPQFYIRSEIYSTGPAELPGTAKTPRTLPIARTECALMACYIHDIHLVNLGCCFRVGCTFERTSGDLHFIPGSVHVTAAYNFCDDPNSTVFITPTVGMRLHYTGGGGAPTFDLVGPTNTARNLVLKVGAAIARTIPLSVTEGVGIYTFQNLVDDINNNLAGSGWVAAWVNDDRRAAAMGLEKNNLTAQPISTNPAAPTDFTAKFFIHGDNIQLASNLNHDNIIYFGNVVTDFSTQHFFPSIQQSGKSSYNMLWANNVASNNASGNDNVSASNQVEGEHHNFIMMWNDVPQVAINFRKNASYTSMDAYSSIAYNIFRGLAQSSGTGTCSAHVHSNYGYYVQSVPLTSTNMGTNWTDPSGVGPVGDFPDLSGSTTVTSFVPALGRDLRTKTVSTLAGLLAYDINGDIRAATDIVGAVRG